MEFLVKRGKNGFTLIELLVVIAIIGILATIVLVSLNSARQKARDTRRIGDLRQVALALEMYYDDNSTYPSSGGVCTNATWDTMATAIEGGDYMTVVPDDPVLPGSSGHIVEREDLVHHDLLVRVADIVHLGRVSVVVYRGGVPAQPPIPRQRLQSRIAGGHVRVPAARRHE